MLCSCGGGASALAQDAVKARDVLGRDPADALASEHLLRVSDRRAIRTDGRRLAFERAEPTIGPFDESDRGPRPIGAVLDRGRHAMESDLSLLAVPPDGF